MTFHELYAVFSFCFWKFFMRMVYSLSKSSFGMV